MRILLVIVMLATGCAAGARARTETCLRGPVPRIGRQSADENYAYLRRELARAGDRTSVAAARIIEELPRQVIDASDLGTEPECGDDMVAEARAEIFSGGKVTYSRRMIARLRSVGRTWDVVGTMDDKARLLIDIAELRDDQLTDYQLDRDEPGPRPPKSLVRYMAIGYLARSSLGGNVAIARDWLNKRGASTTDPRELLLLRYQLGGHVRDERIAAALAAQPSPVTLELALELLHRASPGPVVDRVIALHGAMPVAAGIPGAAVDLYRTALAVLPSARHGSTIAPTRTPFDPWKDWLDLEPARGTVPEAVSEARLDHFDGDLARVDKTEMRCLLYHQIARWTPDALGLARFEKLVQPVIEGSANDPIFANTYEARCEIGAALSLTASTARDRQVWLATQLLRDGTQFKPYDFKRDKFDSMTVLHTDDQSYKRLAAYAIAEHPEWDAQLGPVLDRYAMEPVTRQNEELIHAIEPALERYLRAAPADDARRMAHAWLKSVEKIARNGEITSIWPGELAEGRIYAVAAVADKLDIRDEVELALGEIEHIPLPNESLKLVQPRITEAAAIVLASLPQR